MLLLQAPQMQATQASHVNSCAIAAVAAAKCFVWPSRGHPQIGMLWLASCTTTFDGKA